MRISIRTVFPLIALLLATWATVAVTVVTDEDDYNVGETVRITIHNIGPEDVEFNSAPFIMITNLDTNDCVYGCTGLPVMTPFPAGTTVTESWDTGLHPDVPGIYRVRVNILDTSITADYVLDEGVGVANRSWGAVKALYRD